MTDEDLYRLVDSVDEIENGDIVAIYIKWHVDPPQARRVIHSYAKEQLGLDDDDIENMPDPKYERWRKVPSYDECGGRIMRFVKGAGRGSFPVTVVDLQDWVR